MDRVPRFSHHDERRGSTNWPIVVILASLALLSFLVFGLVDFQPVKPKVAPPSTAAQPVPQAPLVIYVAASNKGVIEAIRQDYEREFHTEVQVQYGASQSLLASLAVSKTGDLYLPADDTFLKSARERQLITDEFPLAEMTAVVAVKKGNPLGIATLADLLRADVRIAQGNTDATAIGTVTKAALTATGQWDALEKQTTVFKTTVNDVANDVKLGAVDAGIVYAPVLHDYDSLEGVTIPELAGIRSRVAVAILKSSPDATCARHFARYLSAGSKGLVRYREFGFETVPGNDWSE